ncbi:MAG: HAD family hydrolase [bacterium]
MAMPDDATTPKGIIFWDLAGTVLTRDGAKGHIVSLAGFAEAMTALQTRYAIHLTTSDDTDSARDLLRSMNLLQCFHGVHGNFRVGTGKPYGELATELDVPPESCLAIGDNLYSDVPADSDRVVTVLINQEGFTLHAAIIAALVELLESRGESLCAGYEALFAAAQPLPDSDPPLRQNLDGIECFMFYFEHRALNAPRPVILLPG